MNVVSIQQPQDQPDLWDIFYQLYPRHEARKDALRAWGKLDEIEKVEAIGAIYVWRQVWKAQGREQHLIPLPATWLNGERWTDEVPKGVIPRARLGQGLGQSEESTGQRNVTGDAHPTPRAQIPAHVLETFRRLKEGK